MVGILQYVEPLENLIFHEMGPHVVYYTDKWFKPGINYYAWSTCVVTF